MWIIPKNHPASCLLVPDTAASSLDLLRRSADLCASSLTWRGKHTLARTWFGRLKPGRCLALLSGRICGASTADPSPAVLTSLLAATHASHSASQGSVSAPTTPATSGPNTSGSSENAAPGCASSRTCAGMCPKDCERCDATWNAWATALKRDYSRRRKSARTTGANGSISWPTPTVCGNHNRAGASARSGDGLATADRSRPMMWATPVARDSRAPGRSRFERTGSKAGDPLPQQVGGTLNPTWVEWLMGVPTGWTDCDCSGTESSPPAPSMPSEPSPAESGV